MRRWSRSARARSASSGAWSAYCGRWSEMTMLLAAPEVAVPELPEGDELRLFDGEPTLEERIAGAWDRLAAGQTAEGPLCSGALRPRRPAAWARPAPAQPAECPVCGGAPRPGWWAGAGVGAARCAPWGTGRG